MFTVIQHFIQRDILRSLSRQGSQSFGELRPDGIENGLFAYHLKQLLSTGLIVKEGEHYHLSSSGLQYTSIATRTNIDILPQPKVFCLLLIENEEGQFIMHRRHAAPFNGQYTFPGGSLFYGEDLDDLVERQLIEKVGFAIALEHRGIASLRYTHDGATISHNYAHIFHGIAASSSLIKAKDARFTPRWIDPSQLPSEQVMDDVTEIIRSIKSSTAFFYLDIRNDG